MKFVIILKKDNKKESKVTEKEKEICISEPKTIADIRDIQNYLKAKGETATESEIVQSCINLVRRLGAEDWGIYLEVTYGYDKCFKEGVKNSGNT